MSAREAPRLATCYAEVVRLRGVLGACVLLGGVSLARAEPVRAAHRLVYQVPDGVGCVSEEEFSTSVEQELGGAVFDQAAGASVELVAMQSASGWSLTLRLVTAAGEVSAERSLSSAGGDCASVMAGARLALVLLLEGSDDVSAPEQTAPEETAPVESTPVEVAAPPTLDQPAALDAPVLPAVDTSPEPDRPATLPHWEVSAGPVTYARVVHDLALGVGVEGGYRFDGRFGLELGAAMSEARDHARDVDGVPVRLALGIAHASAGASYALYRDVRWSHALGVSAHVGRLAVDVEGAAPVGNGRVPWAALGARFTSRAVLVEPLALAAGAEVLTPLLDDQFTEVDGTLLAELAPVGGLAFLRIGAVW